MSRALWTEGDSYMDGAGGADLKTIVGLVTGRDVSDTSVGGATMADIRDRIVANTSSKAQSILIVWDGSTNGYVDAASYTDELETGIDALGHSRFVVIPSAVPFGLSYTGSRSEALHAEFISRWPDNTLSWRDWIANTDGTINEDRMLDYPTDPTHLNQTAMNEMAAGIKAFIDAKAWG
jgi:hypothetical protein